MNMDGVSYDPSVIVASILAFKSESEELLALIASNFSAAMLIAEKLTVHKSRRIDYQSIS